MDAPETYELLQPDMPTVAIVGRPNVGKSALFNRIVGRRQAIVHSEAGVTRDRVTTIAEFGDRRFMLVDTGGLGVLRGEKAAADDLWNALIRRQLEVALESADEVILVVDAQEGIAPMDQEVADWLRATGARVTIAANKADNASMEDLAGEFGALGFDRIHATSCLHNRGIHDLLEAVTAPFPVSTAAAEEPLKVCIVGRPNVGKSSIINRLLGEERVMVSEVAGTTRDAVDIPMRLQLGDRVLPLSLVDTAGIRRRGKINEAVEHFSMARSEAAIARADVCILVLDANQPATAQDKKIAAKLVDAGKPTLILLNKWDLASQEIKQKELMELLEFEMAFMKWAKVQTCCALSGYNFATILPTVVELAAQLDVTIPTSLVNRVIADSVLRMPAPMSGRGRFKVYYALHTGNRPPKFILFVNSRSAAQSNYLAYLEGQLRRAFGLDGLPLQIELRIRQEPEDRATERRGRVRRAKSAGGSSTGYGKKRNAERSKGGSPRKSGPTKGKGSHRGKGPKGGGSGKRRG